MPNFFSFVSNFCWQVHRLHSSFLIRAKISSTIKGRHPPTGWPWTHYPWFLPLCQNDFLKNSWQSPASYGIISKVSYVEWYSSGWRGRFAKSLDRLYRCGSSNLPHSATGTDLVRDPFFYFYRKKEKAMWNNDHLIFAFHLPRGTCSSHRSDRETLSQLSFMP